ncbi:hypothetical protein OCU04_007056 [Sclerotinia nivalis]|uniref:Uncharacterized protein n=1 Tax=Sclerotinia nivalis TaxID=352851 RepID=A0A9X0API1_9HELO|nr:hypothetical protein OCU04_007056 [Sclerotinia nivalis]
MSEADTQGLLKEEKKNAQEMYENAKVAKAEKALQEIEIYCIGYVREVRNGCSCKDAMNCGECHTVTSPYPYTYADCQKSEMLHELHKRYLSLAKASLFIRWNLINMCASHARNEVVFKSSKFMRRIKSWLPNSFSRIYSRELRSERESMAETYRLKRNEAVMRKSKKVADEMEMRMVIEEHIKRLVDEVTVHEAKYRRKLRIDRAMKDAQKQNKVR